jgi:hypothetical protein
MRWKDSRGLGFAEGFFEHALFFAGAVCKMMLWALEPLCRCDLARCWGHRTTQGSSIFQHVRHCACVASPNFKLSRLDRGRRCFQHVLLNLRRVRRKDALLCFLLWFAWCIWARHALIFLRIWRCFLLRSQLIIVRLGPFAIICRSDRCCTTTISSFPLRTNKIF